MAPIELQHLMGLLGISLCLAKKAYLVPPWQPSAFGAAHTLTLELS